LQCWFRAPHLVITAFGKNWILAPFCRNPTYLMQLRCSAQTLNEQWGWWPVTPLVLESVVNVLAIIDLGKKRALFEAIDSHPGFLYKNVYNAV